MLPENQTADGLLCLVYGLSVESFDLMIVRRKYLCNQIGKCYQDLLKYLDNEEVILDFIDVDYVITAFLNPIIGDLIINQGKDVMKKIAIINADESVISKIKLIEDGALIKVEYLERE